MLRKSSHSLYFAVPTYDRGAKSSRGSQTGTASAGGLPGFLARKSTTKFLDRGTMVQFNIDRKTRFGDPFSLALRNIANQSTLHYSTSRTLHGHKEEVRSTYFVDSMLRDKKRLEWAAPWFDKFTTHEKRRLRSKTAHVEEVGGAAEDHYLSGLESFDAAASELCRATALRWPFVQQWIADALKWWLEPVFAVTGSRGVELGERDLLRAISLCREDSIDNEKIVFHHFPRCLQSPTQIRSLKSRAFAMLLQGYACSGARASAPVEQAVLRGVGDHLVALHTPPAQLLSVLLQALSIGFVRHQSYADFSRLGLVEVGRAAGDSSGAAQQKLPTSVALSMKHILRRDPDTAVLLAYAACVYCSPAAATPSKAAASSNRVSIPSCNVDFNGNLLSTDMLSSHPPSRAFFTLSLSWGFPISTQETSSLLSTHPFLSNLKTVSSATWLFEMASSAFLSLVDCSIPCGSHNRVLRAMTLVSNSAETWVRLQQQQQAGRGKKRSSGDLLSCAAVLICVARLAPVLEKLEFVENAQHQRTGGKKFLESSSDSSTSSAENESKCAEEEEEDSTASSSSSSESEQKKYDLWPSIPPTEIYPTSIAADQIDFVEQQQQQQDADESSFLEGRASNFDEEAEARASTRFAESIRSSVTLSLEQLAPVFGVSVAVPRLEEKSSSSSKHNDSSSSAVNVSRAVVAELADALEFVSACGVFRGQERSVAGEMAKQASQVALCD